MSRSNAGVVLAPVVIHLERSSRPRPAAPSGRAGPSFSAVMERARAAGQAVRPDVWPGIGLLREAARGVGRGDQLLDRALRAARAGHVFSNEELLALQAGVYRHSQELELASKLVDKSTSAVRYVLQSQR